MNFKINQQELFKKESILSIGKHQLQQQTSLFLNCQFSLIFSFHQLAWPIDHSGLRSEA